MARIRRRAAAGFLVAAALAVSIASPASAKYVTRFDCEGFLTTGIDATTSTLRSYADTILHDCSRGWNYHTYRYKVTGGGYTAKSTSKDYTDSFGHAYTLGGPSSSMVMSYHFVRDNDTPDPGTIYSVK